MRHEHLLSEGLRNVKETVVGLQYAAAQHSSPGPFISVAQASVFNPSCCSDICHSDHLA